LNPSSAFTTDDSRPLSLLAPAVTFHPSIQCLQRPEDGGRCQFEVDIDLEGVITEGDMINWGVNSQAFETLEEGLEVIIVIDNL